MKDREGIIEQIHEAFGDNEYRGDGFLLGSFEGCEPFDELGPFKGKKDWRTVDPEFLDQKFSKVSSDFRGPKSFKYCDMTPCFCFRPALSG